MRNTDSFLTKKTSLPPEIVCGPLPIFDHTDIESVRQAFQSATPCALQQAWLEEEMVRFSPAGVRTAWRGNSLLVFAELTDTDIFNDATQLNQRTWELGDVFEMFLRPVQSESYVEFHVTPNNQRLQLRYSDTSAAELARTTGSWKDFLVADECFHSRTWIESGLCRWQVYAEISALTVCGSNAPIKDAQWRFSFSRYDYTRGIAEPVISSTSPHTEPDFHRQHEWGVLTFQNSVVIQN